MTVNVSHAIANVFNSTANAYQATPVTVYFNTTVQSGSGNVLVNSGSTSVVGYGTSFLSTLGDPTFSNYVLKDYANNYIGRISTIHSDTSATLVAPAAAGITSNVYPTNFKYQVVNHVPITYDATTYRFTGDSHQGNGTITTSNVSNTITGTSTIFTKQFDIGYQRVGEECE